MTAVRLHKLFTIKLARISYQFQAKSRVPSNGA